jgi:hypothetical protein
MRKNAVFSFIVAAILVAGVPARAGDHENISQTALEPLRRMCDFLGSLDSFSLRAENSMEVVLDTGLKLMVHRSVDLSVRRPDKVRADIRGDRIDQRFYYDGKNISLHGLDLGFYATEPAPPEIDKAMDFALEEFNLTAPMAELIHNSPCARLIEGVKSGFPIGESKIDGVECIHLAFRMEDLDWQIWIEKDPGHPFPRKFVITDNRTEGFPQFTGVFGSWKPNAKLPDDLFAFSPPEHAKKIEFLRKKKPDKVQ